ncbi:hypothetical protein [Arthrobacter sp. StoSoilB13]|uniref:hypothetical protein n=1 Tax=Arthrobacter sp. StoSoilB13 TaxID=2830993 RepID=UPI001CC7BA5C|nr:hypothetical protein [Arthrobacter sp. StoSoilB13]BCW47899.1 hypothetical protein StoSoilB13_02410 [Arthrobacter sp. StoSoilB13]
MWRYFSVSTDTWAGKVELEPSEFTGGRSLNSGQGGTARFNVRDARTAAPLTIDTLRPWERILVAEWDGNAVYAGFITGVDEDLDAGTVTVRHQDIWSLWESRHVLTVRGDGAQSAAPFTLTSKTLPTIAFRLVANAMTGDPAARYDLPLIMNADVSGTETRTYYGYKFQRTAAALKEITDADGGPDIDFDTQWDNGTETFRWVMRCGALTQGLWEWDATAAKKEVFGLTLKTDASKVANRVIATGEGSERNMIVRDDDSFTGTGPALEAVKSYQGMPDGGQLQQRATADLNASNDPTQQMSFKIRANGSVTAADLILGGTCRVKTSGLYFLTADWHEWRLIGFTFDRDWITLQIQEIGG